MANYQKKRGRFVISTSRARLDVDAIHSYLSQSYWARGRARSVTERSVKNSICFGLYDRKKQIGFARVISDFATFGYLCDVYVVGSYQGQGLGRWLLESIMSHPGLQPLRRWLLATRDAHGLYGKFGFVQLESPENWMEMNRCRRKAGAAMTVGFHRQGGTVTSIKLRQHVREA
jgi:GNAT superfamily N-acetyltransferase